MTRVRVRRAATADFDAVAALLEEMGRPRVRAEDRDALRVVFERHVERPDVGSLVALLSEGGGGDRIVGFLSLEFRARLNWTSLEAWVPDLSVTSAARRRGVARALLEGALEAARARGCHRLTLESGYQRRAAHALYESAGMEDLGKFYARSLR